MNEFNITKREILFSVIILSLMVGLGVWISNPILQSASESALKTVSSVQVSDTSKFGYIKRTNAGDFLAEGTMSAKDPVSIPEISGKYLKIEKVKERYTMHTRTVTTTDGKGHTRTRTETYWTWDVVNRDIHTSKNVLFLGETFKLKDIRYYIHTSYKETQPGGYHIRYKYYTHPTSVKGVMYGVCDNKKHSNLEFKKDTTIEREVEKAENRLKSTPIIFWTIWLILTAGLIVGFYYLENNWLEDKNNKPKTKSKRK